jgi:hypothetical protein
LRLQDKLNCPSIGFAQYAAEKKGRQKYRDDGRVSDNGQQILTELRGGQSFSVVFCGLFACGKKGPSG